MHRAAAAVKPSENHSRHFFMPAKLLASFAVIGLFSPVIFAGEPAGTPPADILTTVRMQFSSPYQETRYLSGAFDLNADRRPEWIIHVVGPIACGTGGCPTLLFSPQSSGYKLVSKISVTKLPVRVAAGSSKGWRNLIVHVGGGGAEPAEVELAFNGKSYPSNPTVTGKYIKPAVLPGSEIVIDEFESFNDAKPLPESSNGNEHAASTQIPSFNCNKTSSKAEKLVCGNAKLAALDRQLAANYAKAMSQWPAQEQTKQRAAQRNWITERNACTKNNNAEDCLQTQYQHRLIELQIRGGQLEAPTPVGYLCKGYESQPFLAVFYNQTAPPSAVLTFGDKQEIVFAALSGSGARYTNKQVDFWEHHGEAAVTWSGRSFTCMAR